jgi:hypothetical protein
MNASSILTDASGTMPLPVALRGFAVHSALATRSGAPPRRLATCLGAPTRRLATHSGAAPRIDIYSPGVGNTLGGFASHWHLFSRR